MPELPEVETIRKQLSQEMIGAEIVGVDIRVDNIFVGDPNDVIGQKIAKVSRVGKYLFVHFENGRGLAIHLKMTGRLVLEQGTKNIEYQNKPHTRVVISMKDSRKVYYWDTRRFGYLHVSQDIVESEQSVAMKMGPEPWNISDIELLRKLQKTGRSIKEAILDQHLLAGVGNIYANDGLWDARIDPRRKANGLKLREVKKIRASLVKVLKRGLATGGASDNSYVDAYGERGTYQNEFLTYRRAGEPCNRCATILKRIVVGGRGTWVCEKCQK